MDITNSNKIYHSTNHRKFSCQYHIIFCPKYRRKVLTDNIDTRLKELILEKQKEFEYEVIEMEVMPDHIHLLLDIPPTKLIHQVIGQIKGYSANVLRKEFPILKKRIPSLWTRSYFVSSVGSVSLEVVKKYIEEQKGK